MTPSIRSIHLANGVRLQYAEQGDPAGMPVVLLHGITDSWHSFEPAMAHLPATLHVYALSQRGHGESDRPGRYRTRDFAGDAAAFIEQLGPHWWSGIRWAAQTPCGSPSTGPSCCAG